MPDIILQDLSCTILEHYLYEANPSKYQFPPSSSFQELNKIQPTFKALSFYVPSEAVQPTKVLYLQMFHHLLQIPFPSTNL